MVCVRGRKKLENTVKEKEGEKNHIFQLLDSIPVNALIFILLNFSLHGYISTYLNILIQKNSLQIVISLSPLFCSHFWVPDLSDLSDYFSTSINMIICNSNWYCILQAISVYLYATAK